MTTTSTLTNLREVGGPGLQDARPRTVYRANTERVGADAYPHGLAAVVDLRRDDEVARVPHPLGTTDGYRLVPLFDPSTVESGAQAVQLEEQYIDWLERHRTGIAAAFRAIARSDGDVLVCCSAGKDRTGVVSGLLARLWGRRSRPSATTTPPALSGWPIGSPQSVRSARTPRRPPSRNGACRRP
nr:tyrosine-protein phosphatase [Curtobacterium sp. MWU13-2055]